MKLMARYLTREIAGGIMAVLLGFLGLFAFFDLINELDDIGQGGYRLPQAGQPRHGQPQQRQHVQHRREAPVAGIKDQQQCHN